MGFTLTDEQVAAVDAVTTGGSVAIEALAGAGKTSTLVSVAEALESQGKTGMYVSFSKAIVVEASEKFPTSVQCRTAHSLAFGAVGRHYKHRLNARRLKAMEIARILDTDQIVLDAEDETFTFHRGAIASYVMQAVGKFCMSGDETITRYHFPRNDRLDPAGEWKVNGWLADECLGYAHRAWEDIADVHGQLKFEHNYYLKLWALDQPAIKADYLLVDEAQDLNPAMASIVDFNRDRLQVVAVGDSNQAIYAWNGAVDYLGTNEFDRRSVLTRSFRFGPEIAEQANHVLRRLECPSRVEGAGQAGVVGEVPESATFLARTNAGVLSYALMMIAGGRRPHIVGGTQELTNFCYAARDLQGGKRTQHPDLAAFDSWGEVLMYVEEDELGKDLRTLVRIVDEWGPGHLIDVLYNLPSEEDADAICSTAHKSKGREWDYVRLAGDFPVGAKVDREELKLLYVAVTRAQVGLDVDAVDVEGVLAPVDKAKAAERPTPAEWVVPCGYCGAAAGVACVTRTGGDVRHDYIHIDRKEKLEAEG